MYKPLCIVYVPYLLSYHISPFNRSLLRYPSSIRVSFRGLWCSKEGTLRCLTRIVKISLRFPVLSITGTTSPCSTTPVFPSV